MRVKQLVLLLVAMTLIVGLLTCITASIIKSLYNAAFDDFKGAGETESWNVREARSRGVLVKELVAEPAVLSLPGGQIRFGEAWIEERALSTHRLVWFPMERRIGGYRLQFTLVEGEEFMEKDGLMFIRDNRTGQSVGGNRSSTGMTVYIELLEEPDVADLRLSVVKSFDEPLKYQVRFVPK